MSSSHSVTAWLNRLQDGDAAALDRLWDRYFLRLLALARQKLPAALQVANEEDVAVDAFASFWRGAQRGRFPELASRDNLWRLLVVLTARKASRLARAAGRRPSVPLQDWAVEHLADAGPSPQLQAEASEQLRLLLQRLGD